MKNSQILSVLITLVFFFTACEKQLDIQETVTVTINDIAEDVIIVSGNSVNIGATFTDPTELHNYSLVLTNETANTTVLDINGHSHATTYTVDSMIVLTVSTHSDFMVAATGTNHSGEMATDTVHFHVQP